MSQRSLLNSGYSSSEIDENAFLKAIARLKGYVVVARIEEMRVNDLSAREVESDQLDGGACHLFGTCNYEDFTKDGVIKAGEKNHLSGDQGIIGFTHQGLPFQIMIESEEASDDYARSALFARINKEILPLIPKYAEKLRNNNDDEESYPVIEELFTNLRPLRAVNKFEFDINIVLEKNNMLSLVSLSSTGEENTKNKYNATRVYWPQSVQTSIGLIRS